jgi:hypothetical protein
MRRLLVPRHSDFAEEALHVGFCRRLARDQRTGVDEGQIL